MTTAAQMQIVAPFKPFPAESAHHQALEAFDWDDAIQMMAASARFSCECPVTMLTDLETTLPEPAFRYPTTETRLMLWVLEVTAAFLDSPHFDRDTVIVDCDQLFYKPVWKWFTSGVDLSVLVRPTAKHLKAGGNPLLNGVMWLNVRARDRLVAFFRQALALAKTLPDDIIVWGADTAAERLLLDPIEVGRGQRAGLTVQMIHADDVIETFSAQQTIWLKEGRMPPPHRTVLDFRAQRKWFMRPAYEATILKAITCA